MSIDGMDNETIGSLVAEYRGLKEKTACLKVKLGRARESFQEAAGNLDHSILESDSGVHGRLNSAIGGLSY